MKIRFFWNKAFYWRKPLRGNKGPTQCPKCTVYGHGAKNCNRVVVVQPALVTMNMHPDHLTKVTMMTVLFLGVTTA